MRGTIDRPSIVTAAAVLLYSYAGISGLAGFILLGAGALSTGFGTVLTLVAFGQFVLYLVLATMILKASNTARITTIVFLSISIVLSVVNFDTGMDLLRIGVALLIIGMLAWNSDATDYFGSTGKTRQPSPR